MQKSWTFLSDGMKNC